MEIERIQADVLCVEGAIQLRLPLPMMLMYKPAG